MNTEAGSSLMSACLLSPSIGLSASMNHEKY